MTSPNEILRKLLNAHFKGDEDTVRALAWEIVEKERRLNHHTVATELERLLTEANGTPVPRKDVLGILGHSNGNLPKDKERNACLVDLREPKRTLEELVLTPPVRAAIDRVVNERRKAEMLRSHGVKPQGKLLFCGPPGCGKSVVAEALAHELYLPLATVRFDAVVSSYLGETAANLRKVFDFARTRPMVLLFDEFDAIGKQRAALDEHGELKRVVSSFLQLLDNFHSETLTIAATNHQGLLDPALWRRFDDILYFAAPSQSDIEVLLSRQFRQMPLGKTVRLSEIASALEGFSHADIERVANDALKQAILLERTQVDAEVIHGAVQRQIARRTITSNANGDHLPENMPPKRSRKNKR
jgi:SpoVK/Ycf46/Vps4 family AAA+-type ATPase